MMLIIGVDPGTITGFAIQEPGCGLRDVRSYLIHQAMERIRVLVGNGHVKLVVFEDARKRTWFGSKGVESRMGAGSIRRDCSIWEDYLEDLGVPFEARKPQAGSTKWDADRFKRMTGWGDRTNNHGRDAALLVWGMK